MLIKAVLKSTGLGGSGIIAFDATLKDYLKEIDEADLLTWEQEKDLATRIIEDNDPEARDLLVRSNLRLVVNIAKGFNGRGMNFADIIEEGNIGLLRAVDSFDPEHGVRFSTYASWWIKQSIKRSLLMNSQPIHIPTYMVEIINHWRYTASELEAKLGRSPEIEEMANELNMPLKKARVVYDIVTTINSGFHGDNDENTGLDETVMDNRMGQPEDALCDEEELRKAIRLLSEIDPREADVLTLRFGLDDNEPLTLKEIGQKLDLTRERVRQIQRSALAKLNELMMA